MICPNCRKPGAVLDSLTDSRGTVLHWTCDVCNQYGTIGEKEIDAFMTQIMALEAEIYDLNLAEVKDLKDHTDYLEITIGKLITERNDLKAEVADLNRLASDGGA